MTIDSAVGVGTTVTLLLPRSLQAARCRPEAVGTSPLGALEIDDSERRGDVLLVEDDKEVAALTRELLTLARLFGHPRRQRRRGPGRSGQLAQRSTRAVRRHDARRRQRPAARARDPTPASRPAGPPDHGLCRSPADMKDGEFDCCSSRTRRSRSPKRSGSTARRKRGRSPPGHAEVRPTPRTHETKPPRQIQSGVSIASGVYWAGTTSGLPSRRLYVPSMSWGAWVSTVTHCQVVSISSRVFPLVSGTIRQTNPTVKKDRREGTSRTPPRRRWS